MRVEATVPDSRGASRRPPSRLSDEAVGRMEELVASPSAPNAALTDDV